MSYVYAMTDGVLVKVGTSRDPLRRLRNMQGASPRRLWIEWVGVGGTRIEAQLHDALAEYREHGEWFDLRALLEEHWSHEPRPVGALMQTLWAVVR